MVSFDEAARAAANSMAHALELLGEACDIYGLHDSELVRLATSELMSAQETLADATLYTNTAVAMLGDVSNLITSAEKHIERIGLVHGD